MMCTPWDMGLAARLSPMWLRWPICPARATALCCTMPLGEGLREAWIGRPDGLEGEGELPDRRHSRQHVLGATFRDSRCRRAEK